MDTSTVQKVLDILDETVRSYEAPVVDLMKVQTDDSFKILITTILSARTKDSTTAKIAERLFHHIDSFEDIDGIEEQDLALLLRPVGFYREKARSIKRLPEIIREDFNGKIPETVEELTRLPGVGRKTANLVSAVAFNRDAICVDTHVHRIMNRLGYISTETPSDTEKALRERLPVAYWKKVNRILVAFGQNKCTPISPHCSTCPVNDHCEQIDVKSKR
ncbi:MAG: endonuclease III domain-containing protein [Candidatus Woesearchaeota archaeon]